MASVLQSAAIATGQPALTPSGAHDLVCAVAEYTFAAAPVINDVVELIELPPGCVIVDAIVDGDDLDTATSLTVSAGTIAGDVGDTTIGNRTLTANLLSADTTLRAAGAVRANVAGFTRIAASTSPQAVGLKIAAAPTGISGTPTVRMTLLYRPMIRGI